jgi:hypothetical protein
MEEHWSSVTSASDTSMPRAKALPTPYTLYTGDHPTAELNVKNAAMVEAVANEALVDWRARHSTG